MPAWIYGKKVPISCPQCFVVGFAKDIDEFVGYVKTVWELTMKSVQDAPAKFRGPYHDLMQSSYGQMAKRISEKHVRDILRKKGYIEMICPKCNADNSEAMYRAAGYQIIRVGNYIFEKQFFEENEAYILKSIGGGPV